MPSRIGALFDTIADFITDLSGLVTDIAHLEKDGDAQLTGLAGKATDKKLGTFLSGIFQQSATSTLANHKLELKIGNSELTIDPKGSVAQTSGGNKMSGKESYAFGKSLFANRNFVEKGVKLEILNEHDDNPKAESTYTEEDLHNLAACYVAARENGLHVQNEADIFKILKGRHDLLKNAGTAYNAFANAPADPANAESDKARKLLEKHSEHESPGLMKAVINKPLGDALKSVNFMTRADFDSVGKIQAELLAIRNACKKPDGSYDPDKLKLVPQGRGKPDLYGLMAKPAERATLMASLGVTATDLAAAQAVVDAKKGIPQDKELEVPVAGPILTATCVNKETKNAVIAAQQLERLMLDIERFETTGADPGAAHKANDLKSFPGDSPASDAIQKIRRAINDQEKTLTPGDQMNVRSLVGTVNLDAVMSDIEAMFDQAITTQTDPDKIEALLMLKEFSSGSYAFNMTAASKRSVPATGPAPITPSGP